MKVVGMKAPKIPTTNKKYKGERMSLNRIITNIKRNIKLTVNLIHRGIVKSHTLLYSEGGHMDPWLSAFPVIVFIIALLLYCSHAAGIIHLPSSWVR